MGDQSKHDKDKIYLQIHKELINVFAPFWDANPKPGENHHQNSSPSEPTPNVDQWNENYSPGVLGGNCRLDEVAIFLLIWIEEENWWKFEKSGFVKFSSYNRFHPTFEWEIASKPQLTFFSSFQQEVSPHISRRVYNRNINRAPNKTYKQGNFIGQVLCLNLCGLFKVHHDPVVAACSSSRVSLAVPVTSSIPFKVLEQAIIGWKPSNWIETCYLKLFF